MINLDCINCDGRCCTSKKRKLYVVLMPHEIEKFKESSTELKTSEGILTVLKKSESGNCVFYDEKNSLCKAYKDRPFECRAYPLLIYYDSQEITFRLDKNVCPKTTECVDNDIEKTKKDWLNQKLSLDFIKAYSTID